MAHAVEQRQRAHRMFTEGQSVRQVAEALDLPPSTVGVWRKAMAEPQSPESDAADKPKKPAQSDLPTNAPPNDDAEAIAKAQDQAVGQVDELVEPPAPPIMDRFKAEAWKRYLNLLVNDVAHSHALEAATKIDEDFHVGDDHARRILHALGKGEEPIRFAGNWSKGTIQPPDYVRAVYEAFRWDSEQMAGLSDYLYAQAQEAYLEGLNAQLIGLGQRLVPKVTDPDVLAAIREETDRISQGIAATFDRDSGGEVYALWAELSAERGNQMSRYWLEQAVGQWANQRAEWKAGQVALTEQGRFYNRGAMDFTNRNIDRGTLTATQAWVAPDECECINCLRMVQDNPYAPDDPALLDIPLHPSCIHLIDYTTSLVDANNPAEVWAAQSDGTLDQAV